jgi:uncharacterized protein YjbI with pentapeptide repeats
MGAYISYTKYIFIIYQKYIFINGFYKIVYNNYIQLLYKMEKVMKDIGEVSPNIKMRKFISKLNNGEIKYRLTTDTNETAKNKIDLRGFEFRNNLEANGVDVDFLTFNYTSFEWADLTGCKFDGCNFSGAFFENSRLIDAEFNQSNFKSSTFLESEIANSKFSDCSFDEQIITNCDMNKSTFNECKFTNSFEIKNTDLSNTQWTKCFIEDGEIINNCKLPFSTFKESRFERVKFGGCDLKNTNFTKIEVNDCMIEYSEMLNSVFESCDLDTLDCPNNNMYNVNFRNTTIQDSEIYNSFIEKIGIFSSKLSNCNFVNASFKDATFDDFIFSETLFQSQDFTGLTIKTPAFFDRCFFLGARFNDITIIKTRNEDVIDVKNSTFENASFNNINPAEVFSNYNPDFTATQYNTMAEKDWEIDVTDEDEDYDEAPEDLANEDKCFWGIGPYNVKNTDYLTKPNNFIIQLPGDSNNYECVSLRDMKQLANLKNELKLRVVDYQGFYECSKAIMDKVRASNTTPLFFRPDIDFDSTVEYVVFGTASKYYVKKPEWLWDGPIPEPKKFKLVKDSPDLKYFVSKSIGLYNADVVSDTHCDLRDNGYVYRLEPIISGGRKGAKPSIKKAKKENKKTVKRNKNIKNRENKKTVKRNRNIKNRGNKKTIKRTKTKKTIKRKN